MQLVRKYYGPILYLMISKTNLILIIGLIITVLLGVGILKMFYFTTLWVTPLVGGIIVGWFAHKFFGNNGMY